MEKSIYEQLYDFENDQRIHLASTVNVPILAVTALGGAVAAMVLGYPFISSVQAWVFLAFLCIAVLSLVTAIVFVFRSLIGYEYEKIPGPMALQQHEHALRAHMRRARGAGHEDDADREATSEFRQSLENAFVRATEANGANNRNRGNYIYRANVCSAVATAALAFAGAIYVVAKVESPPEVHTVRIVGGCQHD